MKGSAASRPERLAGQRPEESKLEAVEQTAGRGTQLGTTRLLSAEEISCTSAITPGDSPERLLLFPCLHTWPLSRTERGPSGG